MDNLTQEALIRGILPGDHGIRTRGVSYLIIMAGVTQFDTVASVLTLIFESLGTFFSVLLSKIASLTCFFPWFSGLPTFSMTDFL